MSMFCKQLQGQVLPHLCDCCGGFALDSCFRGLNDVSVAAVAMVKILEVFNIT
jgi:hypothetical protein